MKCGKVRRKLVAYLDGELGERQKKLIKEHLEVCDGCRKEAEILIRTSCLLKGWKGVQPSSDLEAKFWQKVFSEEKRYLSPRPILKMPRAVFSTVLLGVLAAGILLGVFIEKTLSWRTARFWEEEYVSSSGLDSFQDFPSGSLCEAYFNLTFKEEESSP